MILLERLKTVFTRRCAMPRRSIRDEESPQKNFVIDITGRERKELFELARSKGMTMQGLLAMLVRNEIRSNQSSIGISPLSNEIGTNPSSLDFGR